MKSVTRSSCAVALATLLLTTGCGESTESQKVRLSGWVSSPTEDDLVRALLREVPPDLAETGILYDPIQANYPEKIQLMLATGTAPDVFMLDAFLVPALASYDTLEPLEAFLPTHDLEDFEPRLLDAFRREDSLYGLPKDYSTVALFFNPEAFAEVGLTQPPTNWEELARYAELLTVDSDNDGRVDRYGLGIDAGLDFLLPFIWQNGGELIDGDARLQPNDLAAIEAINWLKDLQSTGVATFPKDVGAAWNMDAFGRGTVAMTTSGYFAISFLEATFPNTPYEVAPLPVGKERATLAFVVGYVMPRLQRQSDSARQLMRFLTSTQAQTYWSENGMGLPPRRSVAAEQIRPGTAASVFTESAEYARIWQFGTNQRLVDEIQTALQAIYLTDEPVEQALLNAAQRLQRLRP